MEFAEITEYLPHRYPFLLVDKVLEIAEDGTRIVALKNVTINEPFFAGHFPAYPVMPGVLMAEALAQAGGILLGRREGAGGKIGFLTGLDKFRFRRPVRPGDTLRLEVSIVKARSLVALMAGRATVDGEVAAEGEIMVAFAPAP